MNPIPIDRNTIIQLIAILHEHQQTVEIKQLIAKLGLCWGEFAMYRLVFVPTQNEEWKENCSEENLKQYFETWSQNEGHTTD